MTRPMRLALSVAMVITGAPALSAQLPPGRPRPSPIPAPANVAISHTANSLQITWSAMAGVSQYSVNQRQGNAQQLLGVVTAPPYSGPLPARGVTYEYQVISIAGSSSAGSGWIPYTVPNEPLGVDRRPGAGTRIGEAPPPRGGSGGRGATVIPAGPATLSATSPMPAQIDLRWPPVTNAATYRVRRERPAQGGTPAEPERTLVEIPANSPALSQGVYYWRDAPVDERFSFTYRVIALFPNSPGTATESSPSPSASVQSQPFGKPANVKYRTLPAVKPGTFNVALTWDPVPGAARYYVTGTGMIGLSQMETLYPSLTIPNVPPTRGTGYEVCVSVFYLSGVGSNISSCIKLEM